MYIYQISFGNGSKLQIRANSPKQANEIASKIGIVSHIKFIR
jgi:hypothetical protein